MHIPTGMIAVGSAARAYKGYVLRMRRNKNTRTIEVFGPACSDFALSTAASVAEAKLWIDGYIDLERTIDDLVYRKKNLDLDSPEYQFINRVLTGLRYSCDEAGGIIEDLDTFGWAPLVVLLSQRPRQSRGKSCRSVDRDLLLIDSLGGGAMMSGELALMP